MLARFVIYTALITALCVQLPSIIADGDVQPFTENHWVEWLQFSLVVGASGLLLAAGRLTPDWRELMLLLAGFCALAALRELDALLDAIVPWLGWKLGPLVILPLMLGLVIARPGRLGRQFSRFVGSPAFVLGWAGFMLVVPIAQLIGHGPFLEALLGEHYHRAYKHVIEESAELIGYMMLAAAAVEAWFKCASARVRPA